MAYNAKVIAYLQFRYAKLNKPWWTPPNWLFGPAWTTLYMLMGTASWMVWKQEGKVLKSIGRLDGGHAEVMEVSKIDGENCAYFMFY